VHHLAQGVRPRSGDRAASAVAAQQPDRRRGRPASGGRRCPGQRHPAAVAQSLAALVAYAEAGTSLTDADPASGPRRPG
jgi:hypothetical protein